MMEQQNFLIETNLPFLKNKTMKNLIIKSLVFVTMFVQVQYSLAQIRGNGNIITEEIEVKPFEKIHINFPVKVIIDANADYALTITTDENILPEIVLGSDNNQLEILQDEWIQPTKMVEAKIGTKGLTKLEVSGYGKTKVINLNEDELTLINLVGNVTLEGKVNTLRFSMETGNLKASKLFAQNVIGDIWSHGEAMVNAFQKLEGTISGNGKLVYITKPDVFKIKAKGEGEVYSLEENKKQEAAKEAVQYVEVKLKNTQFVRIHTQIKGPRNKKFGYGMPFNPKQVRAENYPVGTKIFKVNKYGIKKLLTTIRAKDEGKTIDLFREN